MPLATATPTNTAPTRQQESWTRTKRIGVLVLVVAGLALCAIAVGLSRQWPFTKARVLQDLQEASDSQVQVRTFHQTYFPSPGCVLEGVVFERQSSAATPLITVAKITIQGSYLGLLAQRVSRITAEGMVVTIPPFGTGKAFHTTQSKTTIAEIVANGATVEFASSDPGKKPLRFDVHEAFLRNVGWKDPLAYRVKVYNPEPPGEVTAEGKFGVWNRTNAGETPISGQYEFVQADLSVYEGIAGKLSSTGKFEGKLAHIDISGATDTPDFEVKSGGHPVRLTTKYSAYVDATRGDTFLKQVDADFSNTHVVAQGSVATSRNGQGKTALINLRSGSARIQDLLLLFVKADRAPMSGSVTLRARVEIPPGDEKFLKKIKLDGGFGIAGGKFSQPSTQKGVDELSAGARGEPEKDRSDPETVITDLTGEVKLLNGVATFPDLSFRVPGAHSRVHGTYDLTNYKIDLRGQLRVDSEISNTTSGTKALFLKMVNPFFRKKRKGEVVPVRISGTYDHPTFGLDLNDKNAKVKKRSAK
jgi:hypothetical protein